MLAPLKMWQNDAIIDLLENDNGKDDEKLIAHLTKEAKIDRPTAESYMSSYRENPNEGAIGVIIKQVNKFRLDEQVGEQKKAVAANSCKLINMPPPTIATPAPTPTPIETKKAAKLYIQTNDPDEPSRPKKDPATGEGIVAQILKLHVAGQSNAEIIAAGYNKSTVYRQVNEHKKRKAGKM